jgi:hypothetical protein
MPVVRQTRSLGAEALPQRNSPYRWDSYLVQKRGSKTTVEGSTFKIICKDGVTRTFMITKVICRADGLLCRTPLVAEARCIKEEEKEGFERWIGGPKENLVVKFNFPVKSRPPEDELIGEAGECAKDKDEWALNHLPNVIESTTKVFTKESVQGQLLDYLTPTNYEERVTRVTLQEKLYPLSDVKSAEELAQVFYDILQSACFYLIPSSLLIIFSSSWLAIPKGEDSAT